MEIDDDDGVNVWEMCVAFSPLTGELKASRPKMTSLFALGVKEGCKPKFCVR